MFKDASAFNRPIDGWNTLQVTTMFRMFLRATSFNQCLSTRTRTPNNVDTTDMLKNTACPDTNNDSPNPTAGPWCQLTACPLPP
jgi:surface protein